MVRNGLFEKTNELLKYFVINYILNVINIMLNENTLILCM